MPLPGIHVKDAAKWAHLTMKVKLRGVNQWRVRLWLGAQLIRLAAWVMWMDVEFDGCCEQGCDCNGKDAS